MHLFDAYGYKVIELYFENKKGPLHFCEMALRKYSVFTK